MLEKFLKLSEIAQDLESKNRELTDAIIKIDNMYQDALETIKQKDQMIADLMLDRSRLEDVLKSKLTRSISE